jgi:hypothetical protein
MIYVNEIFFLEEQLDAEASMPLELERAFRTRAAIRPPVRM